MSRKVLGTASASTHAGAVSKPFGADDEGVGAVLDELEAEDIRASVREAMSNLRKSRAA